MGIKGQHKNRASHSVPCCSVVKMALVDLKSTIRLFLQTFSFFGLVQVRYGPEEGQLDIIKSSTVIVPILLIIYWINAIVVICFERPSTDTISLVSNIIQLVLNAVMISVAMIVPIKYMKLARRIIQHVHELVAQLERIRILVDFRKVRRNFCLIVGFFLTILIYSLVYDACITFKNGLMTVKYWFVTILPSVYMVLVLTQAICTLAMTRSFYRHVNRAIAAQIPSEDEEDEPSEDLIRGKMSISQREETTDSSGSERTFFINIFIILGSLEELCRKLESYFGPLFLVTFTTLFVVTSIQLYYCYQIIIQVHDEARGYSYLSLILCVNVVVINVILMASITALCQAITNQVSLMAKSLCHPITDVIAV